MTLGQMMSLHVLDAVEEMDSHRRAEEFYCPSCTAPADGPGVCERCEDEDARAAARKWVEQRDENERRRLLETAEDFWRYSLGMAYECREAIAAGSARSAGQCAERAVRYHRMADEIRARVAS